MQTLLDPTTLWRVLFVLQAFQVAVLWLHDWLPLGGLTDPAAARRADGFSKLVQTTLIQSIPYSVLLYYSWRHLAGPLPQWLSIALWVAYGVLFLGELRAWWLPYLLIREPRRAERYQALFGRTHAFLPAHNGIRPNTLHCLLHLATAATLALLWRLTL
jgi:hypothetical protein